MKWYQVIVGFTASTTLPPQSSSAGTHVTLPSPFLYALIALELRLAERYSAEKAAEVVDALVRRADRLHEHPQLGRAVPETVTLSCASSRRRLVQRFDVEIDYVVRDDAWS